MENRTPSNFSRVVYGYPSVHGAVFSNLKSYGPVRCGFEKSEILRCGSVRLSDIVNSTVRFGAVLKNWKSYGAVRCGFHKLEILRCGSVRFLEIGILWCGFQKSGISRCGSVRFSDIVNPTVRFGAIFTNQKSYGEVRHVSPLNVFSYGAVPLPLGKP